ncbi:MAG: hypothetical protein IIY06_12705 [Proteobacteria bacterium]|nr:hypothetical protein [Pseudomonadota bacterium]
MRYFIKHILSMILAFLTCLVMLSGPFNAFAQTSANAEAIMVSDAQVEAWMGRESAVKHPAVPHLKRAENATLHFYYDMAYERRALDVIESATMARLKNLRFLPKETVENVHIYLLGDMNAYFRAQNAPGRAPEWAAGLSILRDDVILIRLKSVGTTPIEPSKTLAHELNHVALRRFGGDAFYPHWFYEGLAMLSTDDWNLQRAESLAHASMSGSLLDLPGIEAAFGKTGAIVDLAYAESAHFVSWLAKNNGDDKIKKLIIDVAGGKKFDDAFLEIFGHTPNGAFKIWHDAMSKEESVLASFFSGDAIFFYVSVFAALALTIALIRRRRARRERLESMTSDVSVETLPENLRHFGPFNS